MSITISDNHAAKIAAELEGIREKVYTDQPDVMDSFVALLDVLETIFCKHEWITGMAGGDPTSEASAERVVHCKLCGLERDAF